MCLPPVNATEAGTMLVACSNDEVRSLETQLSAQRKESMQKEATLRDIVESRIETIRELSDEQQELEHRCARNAPLLASVDLHWSNLLEVCANISVCSAIHVSSMQSNSRLLVCPPPAAWYMVCRLASKCESYEETMLVLSEWQTYGNSRDAQLSDVNQEVQKLRSEIAVLRNQADGDRREINSLRQQVPHLTTFEWSRMPDIDRELGTSSGCLF